MDPRAATPQHYIYRSVATSSSHRRSVSAYLVQRVAEGGVVRIESLGLVPVAVAQSELALRGLQRRVVIAGSWRATASRRHERVRVRPMPRAAP
jgi:hypothetical protein